MEPAPKAPIILGNSARISPEWERYFELVSANIDTTPGAVTSFNGRAGAVVPVAGDYNHSQLGSIGANDHHDEDHTIESHSDTDATGAELNTLTSGSDADALHNHPSMDVSGMTNGSIPFISAGALAEDNANFFWDDANNWLGIGTNTPSGPLDIIGDSETRFQFLEAFSQLVFGSANVASIRRSAGNINFVINSGNGSLYLRSPASSIIYLGDNTDADVDLCAGGGTVNVNAAVKFSGDISPAQITAQQDNYAPTDHATASVFRLSSDASQDITGLQGGADGRIIFVHNIDANDIVLKDEDASSTAGNRFALNADVTIQADNLVVLQYDSTSLRWRAVAGGGGGGSADKVTPALTNKAGASTIVGYVYRADPDNNDSFDYASENEDAQVIVANSVITDNSTGEVVISGYEDVYVDATTERGDYLYFGSTNGQAKPLKVRRDGCFAQAVAARAGAGLVKAFIFSQETIRQHGWKDLETHVSIIRTPIIGSLSSGFTKSGSNPILTLGAGGKWDDTTAALASIIENPETNEIYMYYRGSDGTNEKTGLAIAAPGNYEGPFVKTEDGIGGAGEPGLIMTVGGGGAWDEITSHGLSVVYDEAETDSAKRWKGIFLGKNLGGTLQYGYAYSADGITWTKSGSNPVLSPTFASHMKLLKVGKRWNLYTTFPNNISIYLYTSDDLITWTDRGKILDAGAGGEWDDFRTFNVSVFWFLSTWYLLYSGSDGTNFRIGMAYTTDAEGSGTFTKFSDNPILDLGAATTWDDDWVLVPAMILKNNTFYLYYTGTDTNPFVNPQVGVAIMEL